MINIMLKILVSKHTTSDDKRMARQFLAGRRFYF